MLGFARFLPASTDVFQKFLFGDCVIGFDVVSANTGGGPNELSDDSIGYRILWNRFRKIDDRFAKPGRSFSKIINAFSSWLFADESLRHDFQNESSVRASRPFNFVIPSSFVIRASSFAFSRVLQLCTAMSWQISNRASPLHVKS